MDKLNYMLEGLYLSPQDSNPSAKMSTPLTYSYNTLINFPQSFNLNL